jgi:aryl-alcohol dehydrogenase-like predicted oxidoreductase
MPRTSAPDVWMPTEPCKRGHLAPRYVRSGRKCVECVRADRKENYRKNEDAYKRRAREWVEKNPERSEERRKAYAKRNSATITARATAWAKANREKRTVIARAWGQAQPRTAEGDCQHMLCPSQSRNK